MIVKVILNATFLTRYELQERFPYESMLHACFFFIHPVLFAFI